MQCVLNLIFWCYIFLSPFEGYDPVSRFAAISNVYLYIYSYIKVDKLEKNYEKMDVECFKRKHKTKLLAMKCGRKKDKMKIMTVMMINAVQN